MPATPIDRETRVAACADYLLGMTCDDIKHKWGISASVVAGWIKATGQFKLRRPRSAPISRDRK